MNSLKIYSYFLFVQYAEHEPETPIERYKRLMAELQELEKEFNQVKKLKSNILSIYLYLYL